MAFSENRQIVELVRTIIANWLANELSDEQAVTAIRLAVQ